MKKSNDAPSRKPVKRVSHEKRDQPSDLTKPLVYDSVKYHWPAAKSRGGKTIEDAKRHIRVAAYWLRDHGMLTPEGAARVLGADVPDDFGISSDMLTEEGNAFMRKAYARWSKTVRYNQQPTTKVLDQIWSEH